MTHTIPNPPTLRWTFDTSHLCAWCRHPLRACGWKRNADGAMRVVYAQCNCEGARQ